MQIRKKCWSGLEESLDSSIATQNRYFNQSAHLIHASKFHRYLETRSAAPYGTRGKFSSSK